MKNKVKDKILLKDEERQECEIWTRIMGYFRPLSVFNPGKKSEFNERKYFSEKLACRKIKEENNVKKEFRE